MYCTSAHPDAGDPRRFVCAIAYRARCARDDNRTSIGQSAAINKEAGRLKINGNILSRSLFQVLALFRRGGWMADYADRRAAAAIGAVQRRPDGAARQGAGGLALAWAPSARAICCSRASSQNEGVLLEACDLLTAAIKDDRPITPAGEWLLDNFYLIEEQIRTARRHLPRDYSRELPRLAQRAVGRAAARLRHRARDHLARRRPGGSGKSRPLRRRLPDASPR